MTAAADQSFDVPKQRGFWLRYFLESEDHFPAGSSGWSALKGHGFSRAETMQKKAAALAAEGRCWHVALAGNAL